MNLLATVSARILRGDDLPFSLPLEPCIGPDQRSRIFLAITGFPDGAFAAIDDRCAVTKEMHFGIKQTAITRFDFGGFVFFDGLGFAVTLAVRSGPLKVISQNCLDDQLVRAGGFCPLTLHRNQRLCNRIAGTRSLLLLSIRCKNESKSRQWDHEPDHTFQCHRNLLRTKFWRKRVRVELTRASEANSRRF